MAVLLYKIFLFFYAKGIGVYALFNRKARMWRNGRKQLLILITTTLQDLESPLIWFHCSSLGEFEQGRPIIELLRSQYKDHKILLTFFSPSGYEVQKNYKEADYVFYLPIDSAGNAEKFLSITKPVLVIFVKYEYWYYYLKAVYEKGIPLILVSSVFNRSQPFFKWYGSLHRKMLGYFTKIFVQDSLSAELVNKIGNLPISIAGDTRFDRVSEISLHKSSIPFINAFKQDKQILIAGSTWPKDEEILYTVFQ
ncbi:MAG: 3-deoxy-D-manno-octulosonic acid transferase, partial [Chitinophagaceae bacterium]|nr:3-deoxy-D-manno-octulosonic acid transferase [Chitinophagaceae bacterium]